MFFRTIEPKIREYLKNTDNKILFIWGPRRSGKTTLIKKLSAELNAPMFNFDFSSDRELFLPDRNLLKKIADSHKVIFIDEVQNFPESTASLKILFDEFNIKIIATGSSELRQKTANFDSLAGRYNELFCLPISAEEFVQNSVEKDKDYRRDQVATDYVSKSLLYGSYPEILANDYSEDKKIDLLQNILDTYVLKDVVNIYNLRDSKLAKDILTRLALQLGSEVSLRELASTLGAHAQTVANYIEIFVKNHVLLPLPAFKTNLRRAISAHKKYFFLDLGLRNVLVRDFREPHLRQDIGGLFENFIVSEIHKKILSDRLHYSSYFYREYGGKEVDYILEDYKKIYNCFEIKFNGGQFHTIFPLKHTVETVSVDNYYSVLQKI